MIVIKRPRISGRTTILLHYMVVNSDSLYVARTEADAQRAFELAQNLVLSLNRERFVSITDQKIEKWREHGYKILIDNADCIVKRHPSIGYGLIEQADVITITTVEN